MSRFRIIARTARGLRALAVTAAVLPAVLAAAPAVSADLVEAIPSYDNPIVPQRADPWIHRDPDTGCYVFIGSAPEFDRIELRKACRLNDLKIAEPKVIWRKKESGPMSRNIWAPELHRIDGTWYVYFAAGEAERAFSIRMYTLSNPDEDPFTDNWTEEGRFETGLDTFSLDATQFEHRGTRYYVWAQQDEADSYNSALWIAELDTPTSIKGEPVIITEPTLDWEIQGYKVNEGAAVLIRHGRIFMTYSASATDHRYAVGLLWADVDADLLDPDSWNKLEKPVFSTNERLDRYGPGHNSFTIAEDGVTDLMIYHARDYRELRGNPLTDPNRHARARPIYWDSNGFPVFGQEIGD